MDRLQAFCIFVCLLASFAGATSRKMVEQRSKSDNVKVDIPSAKVGKNFTKEEIAAMVHACNSTYPTSIENLMEFNVTGEFPRTVPLEAKCYLKCILTRLGVIDEMNNFNTSLAGAYLTYSDEEAAKKFLEKCAMKDTDRSMDVCEQAYEKISCVTKEAIEYSKSCDKKDSKM